MHAAVVELDALADAVGARAQDHNLGLFTGTHLVGSHAAARSGSRAHEVLVCLVVVFRGALELGGARIDRLHARHHAQPLAIRADEALVAAGQQRDLGIARAVLLEQAHCVGVDVLHAQAAHRLLHGDHVVQAVEEPRIDARGVVQALHAPAAAQRLGDIGDAPLARAGHSRRKVVLIQGCQLARALRVHAEAAGPVLERAHGLAERLFERAADRHDLAHGLHARGERRVGALELLKGEAGHLDHAVVDRRLEARRRGASDVVGDLIEGIAHGKTRGGLGDGEARGLGGEGRGAAHARVHLDDDEAAILGVDRELHVRAARLDADLLQNRQGGGAHALVLEIGQGLRGSDGDGVARVYAHGVEVLDGAHDDAVAGAVAHDLHLVFLPALDRFLDEHLARRGQLEALGHDLDELGLIVSDAAARTAHGEARAQHARIARTLDDRQGVLDGVGVAGARHLEAEFGHGLVEELTVLATLDCGKVAADHLDAVALEHAGTGEVDGGVQTGLAAERGQQRVGALALDNALDELRRDGLHIGTVGEAGVGHDGRRIRVDQDNLVTVLLEDLAGLGTGIVELARLADDDRARPDDQDAFDVFALGHASSPPLQNSSRRGGRRRCRCSDNPAHPP